jgi:hypothetical protein
LSLSIENNRFRLTYAFKCTTKVEREGMMIRDLNCATSFSFILVPDFYHTGPALYQRLK